MSRLLSRQRRAVRFGYSNAQPVAPRRLHSALLRALAVLLCGTIVLAAAPATAAPNAAGFTGSAESANARFVVDGYQQLLGRQADTAGLDFHVSRLAAGGDRTRQAFTYSMLFSVEGSRQEVRRAYLELLARTSDQTGEDYWTNHLQGNGVLDLRVLLMSSDEYHRRSGNTDSAWIDALYIDVLGRTADDDGHAYWLAQVQAGVARPMIVAALYLSDEALEQRVDAYYREALDREPTDAERADAVTTIRRSGERGLRAQIWASDEVFEQYLQAALS